jgi:type II secretory pathway component PulM
VLVVLLIGYLIISSWINWQRKLDHALPQLRSDLAQMHQLAEQVRKLPVATAAPATAAGAISPLAGADSGALWAALRADLQQEFAPSHPSASAPLMRDMGQQRMQLSLGQRDFDATLAAIARLQKKYGLSIVSAQFTSADGASTGLQAEIIFERLAAP